MRPDTSRVGLVRGYFIYADKNAGCISLERAKDDNCTDVGIAYTKWYRHDDDPSKVEEELRKIADCYTRFNWCCGGMYGYEYRDYRKEW